MNTALFARIVGRMTEAERARVDGLLDVGGPSAKSGHYRLKETAGRASWSAFRAQVAHMAWADSLGDTGRWLEGVAEAKIADFAGEATAADAGVMGDVARLKRTALLVCMVHEARARARDDLAEMFCKRVASITKRAKNELEAIRAKEAEISDGLIDHYRTVLSHLDPRGPAASEEEALRLGPQDRPQGGRSLGRGGRGRLPQQPGQCRYRSQLRGDTTGLGDPAGGRHASRGPGVPACGRGGLLLVRGEVGGTGGRHVEPQPRRSAVGQQLLGRPGVARG